MTAGTQPLFTDAQISLFVVFLVTAVNGLFTYLTVRSNNKISQNKMNHDTKIAEFNAEHDSLLNAYKDFCRGISTFVNGSEYSSHTLNSRWEFEQDFGILYSLSGTESRKHLDQIHEYMQLKDANKIFNAFRELSISIANDLDSHKL